MLAENKVAARAIDKESFISELKWMRLKRRFMAEVLRATGYPAFPTRPTGRFAPTATAAPNGRGTAYSPNARGTADTGQAERATQRRRARNRKTEGQEAAQAGPITLLQRA